MAIYKLGSSGGEVGRVQARLKELGHYLGPLDGAYGGATDAAVRAFQKKTGLTVDGIVGPDTWRKLFDERPPVPAIASAALDHKCLALTGTFETNSGPPECFAGLSGDFDGQGLSFGALQWNFGQDSLQPLLKEAISEHRPLVRSIFQSQFDVLAAALAADKPEQMRFVRSIEHPIKHQINEPWRGMLKALGRTAECQSIQVKYAARLFQAAKTLAGEYGLKSQRGTALMFDIKVQNGSISTVTRAQILADLAALPAGLGKKQSEVERMTIIANRRAEAANPRWIEDVRARKLCIARGEGVVHGIRYDLGEQFSIKLQ